MNRESASSFISVQLGIQLIHQSKKTEKIFLFVFLMFSLTLCCFCYTVSQSYTSLLTQECQTISTSAHPKKTQDKCNAYSCYRFSKTTKAQLPTSLTYTYMSPILVIDLLFWGQIITIFVVVEFSHKDFN